MPLLIKSKRIEIEVAAVRCELRVTCGKRGGGEMGGEGCEGWGRGEGKEEVGGSYAKHTCPATFLRRGRRETLAKAGGSKGALRADLPPPPHPPPHLALRAIGGK